LRTLAFHGSDNDALLVYSKTAAAPDGEGAGDVVLVVVNLDPVWAQAGTLDLDLDALGLADGVPYRAHDELTDTTYTWTGRHPWVRLDPGEAPAHLLALRAM
jgi:starch synthase (maltosyl-transferring)